MRTTLFIILLLPLHAWGQTDSTLKPIQFREAVTGYGRYIQGTQIYSYDGIDVDNPRETLKKYILAVRDSNATHEYHLFERDADKIKAKKATFWTFFITGVIELTIGAIQGGHYKQALAQQTNHYSTTASTPTPTLPACVCQCWYSLSSGPGPTVYTCGSDATIKTTNPYYGAAVVTPNQTTTYQPSTSTTVDLPTGRAWLAAGFSSYLLGTIISVAGINKLNPKFHFLRSVQYYNRALGKKTSWQLTPIGGFNYSGLRLVGQF